MQARILPYTVPTFSAEGQVWGKGRGAGLHLSEVIRYMREGLGAKLPAQDAGNPAFAQVGLMLETWVEKALAQYVGYGTKGLITPGEMYVDGIGMNPDRYHTRDEKVVEYKATWRSLRKIEDESGDLISLAFEDLFYYYRWQVMAYCHGLGCLDADIVILFVNGDYSYREPKGGPQFRVIQMRFTEQEIKDNWSMILANAEGLRRQRSKVNGKA